MPRKLTPEELAVARARYAKKHPPRTLAREFLAHPEWQKAFTVIQANPVGSIRVWAQLLGWRHPRVVRFLDGLRRYDLAEVASTTKGTTVRIRDGVVLPPTDDTPRRRNSGCGLQFPPRVRFAILSRDKFTCQYCGRYGEGVVLTVDHIVPIAQGGTDDESNLATACQECNAGKADQLLRRNTPIQAVTPTSIPLQPRALAPMASPPPVTPRNTHLGSKELDKPQVTRYGVTPEHCVELIRTANAVLREREWDQIPEDNRGSLDAAVRMLKVAPVERAKPLLERAVREFNPSATGGEQLRSLGHPFITKYVVNEYRRTERDLAQGQLTLLFVERTGSPLHVYGAPKEQQPEQPLAAIETIAAVMQELAQVRDQTDIPRRMP